MNLNEEIPQDNIESNLKAAEEGYVVPVIREELAIDKKTVETGKVKIVKHVTEVDEFVNIPLISEKIEVERKSIGEFVDSAPEVRYEGETMIIPVLKEVNVVRLMLVEEVRVTKTKVQTQDARYIKLRREEVEVKRSGAGDRPGQVQE